MLHRQLTTKYSSAVFITSHWHPCILQVSDSPKSVKRENWPQSLKFGSCFQCNRVCGLGQQTRAVYCHAEHPLPNTASDILPNSRCDFSKQPISAQECNEGPCDGLEWVMSRWAGVGANSPGCVNVQFSSDMPVLKVLLSVSLAKARLTVGH